MDFEAETEWARTLSSFCAVVPRGVQMHMKCIRQRCHDESVNYWATAAFSPGWALQMTRCTPARPRARSEAKNSRQNS